MAVSQKWEKIVLASQSADVSNSAIVEFGFRIDDPKSWPTAVPAHQKTAGVLFDVVYRCTADSAENGAYQFMIEHERNHPLTNLLTVAPALGLGGLGTRITKLTAEWLVGGDGDPYLGDTVILKFTSSSTGAGILAVGATIYLAHKVA